MIDFTPRGSALDLSHTTSRRQQAITNLSSGSREDLRLKDSGTFSMNSRVTGHVKVERKLLQNMQNLLSYSEIQDGKLEEMSKILNRMTELAAMSMDSIQSDSDRSNYNREFLNLVNQFNDSQNETFNGIELFGNGSSESGQQFLDSLKNHWLKATEDLIKQEYGWDPVPSDIWELKINETDTGPYAAYVTTSQYGNGTADVIDMVFDLPDFNAPHTQPQSTTDRVVAHEMVHLLHAQNTYYGDPTGDGSSSAKWLKEGLAEFIHGADDRVFSILGANPSDGEITSLINAIGTGNESWSTSEQYASSYLAARYLDYEIKQAGHSGIKHMTQWMKTQFDANAGAATSGFNTYVATFLSGRNYNSDDNDGFLQAFKGSGGTVSGLDYIKDADKFNYTNNITNSDTGSVRGSDAGGSTSYGAQDVIPDANGAPQGSYVADESSEPISMTFSGDGDTSTLNPISPITFGDTSTYNLSTVDSATATLEYLESLMESVASLRSTIGGNMSVTQNNLDALNHRTTTLAQAVSKTGDTSISDETLSMAKTAILQRMNISMRVQANQVAGDITMTLLR